MKLKFDAYYKPYNYIYHVTDINFEGIDYSIREVKLSNGIWIRSDKLDDIILLPTTGLTDKNNQEIFMNDIVAYGQQNYVVKFGRYNKNAGLKNCAPNMVGASFYLDGNILKHESLNDCDIIDEIIDVDGYMHRFMPDSEKWKNRISEYHNIWGVEKIGNILLTQSL